MSEFQSSNFKKENGGTPDLLGKTELTSPYFFVPPSGDTVSRPANCAPGTLRFNTDIGTLEVFRGTTIGWESIQRRDGQYLGNTVYETYTTGSTAGTGVRGLGMAGTDGGATQSNSIEYLTISTLGNMVDFGNTTASTRQGSGFSSSTRAVHVGGYDGSNKLNVIDFVTISSTGDATDFGDLPEGRIGFPSGNANQIRGVIFAGEYNSGNVNAINFVQIATAGNAVDFGDASNAYQNGFAGASPTRGVFAGGKSPSYLNVIEFITFMTTGDAVDFGDLSVGKRGGTNGTASNSTRMIIHGEDKSGDTITNVIEFLTIATTGNSIDFGDATQVISRAAAMFSSTRGVFSGGSTPSSPNQTNVIEFIEIATTGNATDFGDGVRTSNGRAGASSGHGGL